MKSILLTGGAGFIIYAIWDHGVGGQWRKVVKGWMRVNKRDDPLAAEWTAMREGLV